METPTLNNPPQKLLDLLRHKTEINDHSGARAAIAHWLRSQLHEEGGKLADRAEDFFCVLAAAMIEGVL